MNENVNNNVDLIVLIVGKFNSSNEAFYWKIEIDSKFRIGDYAIVENKQGYDLIEIVGIVYTTMENAKIFSKEDFKNMKNTVKIFSKNDITRLLKDREEEE